MRWPWRTEKRESQPFTDAVVGAIFAQAAGSVAADPSGLAALEVAAGLYARSFAAASIEPAELRPVVGPAVRALIARNLIRRGESVHLIEVNSGQLRLIPVGSWDVRGPWHESAWWYRVDTFGPSGNATHYTPASAVVHARYAIDPARPWHGVAPLDWARSTGTLAAYLETRLGQEAGGTVAHVLPIPQDGGDGSENDPLTGLKADIRNARGGTVLTETTAAGWGEGKMAAPQADWKPQRIGANPPPVLPTLRGDTYDAVLAACGVPPDLARISTAQGQREAFRRFLTTGLEPLGQLVADELAAKLDTPGVRFDFTGTYAHDLAGRAQAFKAMAAGGMDVTKALQLAGLMIDDAA